MKEKEIKIGGEFEIDPKSLNGLSKFIPSDKYHLFASGRIALIAILDYIAGRKKKIIYIPYYICKSVVDACKKAGFEIRFYELNSQLQFPNDDLDKVEKNSTLLFVNYFGFVDANEVITKVLKRRPDITTVYDNVQSYWTYTNTDADFSFTSLRKHFAIPDGALVKSKDPKFFHNFNYTENHFYWSKLIAAILKFNNVNDEEYLYLFKQGEKQLNGEAEITKASIFSHYFYENANWGYIKERRQENCRRVYEIGYNKGLNFLFDYKEGITPMSVPIILNNRDNVRRRLYDNNIFLPVHWPLEYFNKNSKEIKELTNKELSIIVDQRYSIAEINYQMKCIISNIY